MNKQRVTVRMGIFDSVKNSITGSDNSGDQFNEEKFDSSFSSGNSKNNSGNSSLEPETGPDGMPGNQQPQGPQQGQQPNDIPGPDRPPQGGQRPEGSSNPQAGRPEPGSSEPQVSNETRNKMQDAGFNFDQQEQGRNSRENGPAGGHGSDGGLGNDRRHQKNEPSLNGREERKTPVSDRKNDIQEIKSQNEQIIELLKRISHSLQDQGSTGSERSRRHGSRR